MVAISRLTFAVLFGLAITVMSASPSSALDGKEVLKTCENYPGGNSPKLCELYIQSMIGFVNSDDVTVNPKGKLCVGEQANLEEVIKVAKDWLVAHPKLHASNGYDAIYGGLAARYKCK